MVPPERVYIDQGPLLGKLFLSKVHADLIVRTKTQDFQVHKCIVSTASAFFLGATRGSFKESATGVIEVPESAQVMDILIRHMYSAPLPCIPDLTNDDDITLEEKAGIANFRLAIEIRDAADKYLVTDLDRATSLMLVNCYCRAKTAIEFLELVLILEERQQESEKCVRMLGLVFVVSGLRDLVTSSEAWELLHSNHEYQRTVVACFCVLAAAAAAGNSHYGGGGMDATDSDWLMSFARRLGIDTSSCEGSDPELFEPMERGVPGWMHHVIQAWAR